MRQVTLDPHSRANFILTYEILGELVNRYHINDRLHVVSYIHKEWGYYIIYLAQDSANPLSTSFGYFNASLGNFRRSDGSRIYNYYQDFQENVDFEDIVAKIEQVAGLPLLRSDMPPVAPAKDHPYIVSLNTLIEMIKRMPELENDFAVENEICPFIGPYSKNPDNRLWFELKNILALNNIQIDKKRCIYDYFSIGTGAPFGPVYKAHGFISNEAILYVSGMQPLNLIAMYQEAGDYIDVAVEALKHMDLQ